jgi:hypothetical protein
MRAKQLKRWETKVDEAVALAEEAANVSMLPQTVFRDADSGGWWHTHSMATRLAKAECNRTVLPERYFQ